MVKCNYMLFIVINDIKKTKHIKKKLKELDISRYTVVDTFGINAFNNKMSSMMMGSISNVDLKKYSKTIFLAMPSEEATIKLMDEISKVLELDSKLGKGIMFTVPIYKSLGIRK
ncbi:MAG: hypothetical protein N4A63_01865 [Vallitalea sp.]|jgi:nitrogen regulatory protein PII|nr:hypothetical protein [Vallitalea sp.]